MQKNCRGWSAWSRLRRLLQQALGLAFLLALIAGCGTPPAPPTASPPTPSPAPLPTLLPTPTPTADRPQDLTDEEVATLDSLEQVDDYPLYTMHYLGSYDQRIASGVPAFAAVPPAWACTLFAAMGDTDRMVYGRNFDWDYSPALLLFTDPPDGYASVSMVDITYLGFGSRGARDLAGLPLEGRLALLYAPSIPFDGMNERGLAVGMAAVPSEPMPVDPDRETIDSLLVIRRILDHAGDVDEAVAILQSYNIDWGGGPPLHYLIADRSGRAVLVEFYRGEMLLIPNQSPWHLATNFLLSAAGPKPAGNCWRYDLASRQLAASAGRLSAQEAMGLLDEVSQRRSTQWSIVYGMSSGDVSVSMGEQYQNPHTFRHCCTSATRY